MTQNLHIVEVNVVDLKPSEKNPRKWNQSQIDALKESIKRFGMVNPLLANDAPGRENILIGGNFRLKVAKDLGLKTVPVTFITLTNIEAERELNLRLNRNLGEWDFDLLKDFQEDFLKGAGFSSQELEDIFNIDPTPQEFDIQRELKKLNINSIEIKKGDVYEIDGSFLMCGDSTVEQDMLTLMGSQKADAVICDPPYRLMYLMGKSREGKSTTGFGLKKNRRYLETESLPEDFTTKWMNNVAKIANKDFSILCYENWKNLREIWGEMEKHWKVRNMIVWHLPNRNQGYAGANKFFSKHDIAMVGTSEGFKGLNSEKEEELFENQYETALFAIQGKGAHWQGYKKGNGCPTDFIEFNAADEKSSGQAIIFGVKPVEILIPYIKALTRRGQIILEPFGGSGSTLAASVMMGRKCYLMEKSPTYAEVIRRRWEKLTGQKAKKVTSL